MNTLIWKLGILVLLLSAFAACDVIDDPIKDRGSNPPPVDSVVQRVVLIEDYTGHRCKNCPKAAKSLKDIEDFYGERVIGIAVHAGASNFTAPQQPDYPTEFRTPQGTQMANFFGVSFLPVGMTSRSGWTSSGNGHIQAHTAWAASTATLLEEDAKMSLKATADYNASTRGVSVTITSVPLEDMAFDLKYVVLLAEDNIVAPQLMPDDSRNETYVHRHVLRTTFTQALGDNFALSPIVTGDTIKATINGSLMPEWVQEQCEVIVYTFNADTQEILQATRTKVMQ